jgi:hypothetical protein
MKYYCAHFHEESEVRATIFRQNSQSPAEIGAKYVRNAEQDY